MAQPITVSLSGVRVESDDGEEVKMLMDEAADKLAELVNAVSSTGKPGQLTMTISLKPSTAGALAVRGEIKMKRPKRLPREALLWPTPEGNLLSDDPRQTKIDLREVSAPKVELRTAVAA
jgi:hypothetical protein